MQYKGTWTLTTKISGAEKLAWDLQKIIVAMSCMEIHHSYNLPFNYEAILTSEMFKELEKSNPTYISSVKYSLLWSHATIEWFSLSKIFEGKFKGDLSERNTIRNFMLMSQTGIPVFCEYTYSYSYTSFELSDVKGMMDLGIVLIESKTGKLSCKKALKRYQEIKDNTSILSFQSMLEGFNPQIVISSSKKLSSLSNWGDSKVLKPNQSAPPPSLATTGKRGEMIESENSRKWKALPWRN